MIDLSAIKSITIPEGNVNTISRSGIVIWGGDTSGATGLPGIYQEVAYLRAENNTATYIDLGFPFDTKAKILMEYTVVNNETTSYPFGASENSGALRCMVSSPYSGKTWLYGSSGSANKSVSYTHTEGETVPYELILEPGNLTLTNLTTGETVTNTAQGSYTMSINLLLFAQNYNGTIRYGGVRRIGKFRYYDKNDALICDLVPCCRKGDGVCGMYDLVRKTFLTNMGSGTFMKGEDVV